MDKLILILFFFLPAISYGQDVLIDKEGKEKEVTIIEVKRGKIQYKNYLDTDSSIYTIAKKNYIKLEYEDGSEISFDNDAILDLERDRQKEGFKQDGIEYWKNAITIGDTVRVEILYQPLLTSKGEIISYQEDGMTIRIYYKGLIKEINGGKDYEDKFIKFESIKCLFDLSFYNTYK